MERAITGALAAGGGAGVGAEKMDNLERLIGEVNNKILNVKGYVDDEINMVNTNITNADSALKNDFSIKINSILADIDKKINLVGSDSDSSSEIARTRQHLEELINDVRRMSIENRNLV